MWPRTQAIVCCLGLLSGCAGGGSPGSPYVVKARQAQFFKYGPAQTQGADFALPKDTPLTLVKRSFGYSLVKTTDGQTGYVATGEIGPGSAPVSSPTPKPDGAPASSPSRHSRVQPEPEPEMQFVPPEEIPLPKKPGEPEAGFRY